jgi:hypothetical protein
VKIFLDTSVLLAASISDQGASLGAPASSRHGRVDGNAISPARCQRSQGGTKNRVKLPPGRGVELALTSDHHFEQAGFRLLLPH